VSFLHYIEDSILLRSTLMLEEKNMYISVFLLYYI